MDDVIISPLDVANAMFRISDELSQTLDNIAAYLWKRVSITLCYALSYLFNCVLLLGVTDSVVNRLPLEFVTRCSCSKFLLLFVGVLVS